MFLLLRNIIERICAPRISQSDIAYLSILIDEYLDDHTINFPHVKLKPKHHYLKHYPRLILEYGPLIRVWTLRFESKHSYFKQVIKHSQNFINICKTLAEKHQLLESYKQALCFFQDDACVKKSVPLSLNVYSQPIQSAIQLSQVSKFSEISMEVSCKGTLYRKGHFVVLGPSDHTLLLGEIQFIIIAPQNKIYFLIQEHEATLSETLHVYVMLALCDSTNSTYRCIEISKLYDYCPLYAYKRGRLQMISLKHSGS